ncbi:MAG: Lpg1974 family pore-forming outer membrane protein [Simkaniaceae bacterium]|nr:Lpg1974 family pore-forming outer membrane protein [Candidatus Sacchlamyda saccharinae]
MKMDIRSKWSIAALSILGIANTASAARDDRCAPEPPATCYQDDCRHCYCLGPDNYGVNAPTCPKTCDGDFTITVAGFYWNSHQDGMEYAIDNHVRGPSDFTSLNEASALNNLIDAKFLTPDYDWDWGFKAGLGYCSPCDGWDFGILWTWYRGKANDHVERELDDNASLMPIWSAFAPLAGGVLVATDIETQWKLEMNLIDLELGRSFWTSKYLSMRPFVGLRIAYLNQSFDIQHKGGSWSENTNTTPPQAAYNNEVELSNDFKGVGLRGGLNTLWNLGCGWGIYGNFAMAILYGRFDVDHDETNRRASNPHEKVKITDAKNSFRASRGAADLALGLQYQTMFCDCAYGFSVALGWEHHLFFDQNQLWRVVRIGDTFDGSTPNAWNNTGENVFHERRGDLDTQGWTLTVKFDF